ncbi:MAG: tetratricopeptide repeat protein [Mariprofundaceae bacterium]|nr:tetratricopeptide repeat protein [Mariprofundaceae bacterium]
MPRRLARMLTASTASPNPNPKTTPKPKNWSGVAQGFMAAKEAFRTHSLQEAENILLEILEFAPAEPKAWAWLGHILKSQGQQEEASQHFQKAKSLLTKNHQRQSEEASSLPLAHILWQQGEFQSARSMLEALLSAQPTNEKLLQLSAAWGKPL